MVKVESSRVRFTVDTWDPLVPATTKFRGFCVDIERLFTVNVLPVVEPATMADGLKLQVRFDGQDKAMLPVKLVGLVARMV